MVLRLNAASLFILFIVIVFLANTQLLKAQECREGTVAFEGGCLPCQNLFGLCKSLYTTEDACTNGGYSSVCSWQEFVHVGLNSCEMAGFCLPQPENCSLQESAVGTCSLGEITTVVGDRYFEKYCVETISEQNNQYLCRRPDSGGDIFEPPLDNNRLQGYRCCNDRRLPCDIVYTAAEDNDEIRGLCSPNNCGRGVYTVDIENQCGAVPTEPLEECRWSDTDIMFLFCPNENERLDYCRRRLNSNDPREVQGSGCEEVIYQDQRLQKLLCEYCTPTSRTSRRTPTTPKIKNKITSRFWLSLPTFQSPSIYPMLRSRTFQTQSTTAPERRFSLFRWLKFIWQ